MERPKVSVIVPVFKVDAFIEKCVHSLFGQTLDSMEYIFVDDCSPDKSIEILERVLKLYPARVQQTMIVHQTKNCGAAVARKVGIEKATGEYVIQCDSDDWVEKDMYEQLYAKAKEDSLDVVISEYSEILQGKRVRTMNQHLGDDPFYTVVKEPIRCSLWNKLVRREIYTGHEFVYPRKHMMEDEVICSQIFFYAKRIGYVDKPLYNYNLNPSSISHAMDESGILKRWSEAYDNIKIVDRFVRKHCCDMKYHRALDVLKFDVKGYLMPLMRKSNKYYKEWRDTFAEINNRIIFSDELPISLRTVHVITYVKLYPLVNRIIKR